MKKILLGFILVINLNANWQSGNDFVLDMKEYIKEENGAKTEFYKTMTYRAYISGVRDTLIDAGYICIPSGVNGKQIFEIVRKYVEDNPKEWNKSASYLVETPLLDAFPCKKKK